LTPHSLSQYKLATTIIAWSRAEKQIIKIAPCKNTDWMIDPRLASELGNELANELGHRTKVVYQHI